MASTKLALLGTASLLARTALGVPEACSGVCVNTHDPFVIRRDDGTYFRFSTGGRIAVHSAPGLSGPWEYDGAALPDGSTIDLPGNQDLWAPDVVFDGDLYYLYYSVSEFGSQNSAIGVASSPSLDVGTWTDLGSSGVSSSQGAADYNAIDPNLVLAADGSWRMVFGSFWGGLFQVPMASPPIAVADGASPGHIATDPATTAVEGAFVFPHGGYYYLFYSAGDCCGYDADMPPAGEEYRVMACRSESLDGGFVDADGVDCTQGGGTLVLGSHDFVYGPGGQGVLDDPDEGPVLYYHYVDTNIGYGDGQKQFGWNRIDFSSGWPVV